MEFEIKTGSDGREYAVFPGELELDIYCTENRIDPDYHCVNGYLNAILLDDVVTS